MEVPKRSDASSTLGQQVAQSLREGADLRLRLLDRLDSILSLGDAVLQCLTSGGKLLLFGNGGSAADAQHIAAEFVGRFSYERQPLPAIALTTDTSILTSIANDYGYDQVFSRQVRSLARSGDMVIGISTSGNSPNVLYAVEAARELNLFTVGLTGGNGGGLAKLADLAVIVPSKNTARIQECHITIGHLLCEIVDTALRADAGMCGS